MTLLRYGLIAGLLLVPVGAAAAQESNTVDCFPGEFIRKVMINDQTDKLPNYTEPEEGGTRVQKQHPKTRLSGQAKFLDRNGQKIAFCHYSNHVGLVASYAFIADSATDLVNSCTPETCDGQSYWREEYERSDASDNMIHVCVGAYKGLEVPSVKCTVQSTPKR